MTDYEITNTLSITIHDLEKAGIVVDDAVQAGANEVDSISYDLTDREKAEGEAFDAAIAAAHRRAERFAQDTDVMLGPLISVSDTVSPYNRRERAGDALEFVAAVPRIAPTTPLVTQRIAITADVSAVYEVAKKSD